MSHNHLTTLHGELSNLPSLRVSVAKGPPSLWWGLEPTGQGHEGKARPQAGASPLPILVSDSGIRF